MQLNKQTYAPRCEHKYETPPMTDPTGDWPTNQPTETSPWKANKFLASQEIYCMEPEESATYPCT
jgi:hypothetical protein